MVGLFTAFILDPNRYLIAAAGAALTVLLPGLLLLAREPKAAGLSRMGEESPFDHNAIDDVIHGRIRLGVVAYLSAVEFGPVLGAARQGRRHRRQPLGASAGSSRMPATSASTRAS